MRPLATFFALLLALPSLAPAQQAQPAPPPLRLELLYRGLDHPVQLTHDKTDRLFVVEQPGRIRLITDGKVVRRPFLDIEDKVYYQGECGLLSVAFHPDFATNGLLYVNYTAKVPTLKTIIAEFKADPKSQTVIAGTQRIILTIDQPFPNHNGGLCVFGPDGMLYIGMGDGGAANDPGNRAQNPRELLGKILRIDVAPREGYAVPKDNPFVGKPEYAPEIWAMGMRNPWRFSFDSKTGLLYAADVGQDKFEEIDIITRGGNYGWRIKESFHDFRPVENPPALIDPIAEYPHDDVDKSITGGLVYRGKDFPALQGWYIYGDYSSGRIRALKYEDGKVLANVIAINPYPNGGGAAAKGPRPTQPSSFGQDVRGELYLCDYNGGIYRVRAD